MLTEAQCVHIDFILFVTLFNIVERCVYAVEHRAQSGSVFAAAESCVCIEELLCKRFRNENEAEKRLLLLLSFTVACLFILFLCQNENTNVRQAQNIQNESETVRGERRKKSATHLNRSNYTNVADDGKTADTRARARWNRISGERVRKYSANEKWKAQATSALHINGFYFICWCRRCCCAGWLLLPTSVALCYTIRSFYCDKAMSAHKFPFLFIWFFLAIKKGIFFFSSVHIAYAWHEGILNNDWHYMIQDCLRLPTYTII